MDGFHENPDHNRYFVAYVFSTRGGGVGNGWTDFKLDRPIRCGGDLTVLTEQIKQGSPHLDAVTITNFRRFDSD